MIIFVATQIMPFDALYLLQDPMARKALIALVLLLCFCLAQNKPLEAHSSKYVQTGWLQLVDVRPEKQGELRQYSLPIVEEQPSEPIFSLGQASAQENTLVSSEAAKGWRIEKTKEGFVSLWVEEGSKGLSIKVRFILVAMKLTSSLQFIPPIKLELINGVSTHHLTHIIPKRQGLDVREISLLQGWKSIPSVEEIKLELDIINHTLSITSLNIESITLAVLVIDEIALLPHKIILAPALALKFTSALVPEKQALHLGINSITSQLVALKFFKYKCPMGSLWLYGTEECVSTCQKKAGSQRYQVCLVSRANLMASNKTGLVRYLSGYGGYGYGGYGYGGYGVSCSTTSCPGGWTTASLCKKCGSSYKITKCISGYYLRSQSCRACTLSHCTDCYWSSWKNKQMCTDCSGNYYPKSGVCQTCPDTCLTCKYWSFAWWSGIKCQTCAGNLVVLDKMCECYSNQYMVSSPSYNCIDCPTGTKYCSWDGSTVTATACYDGYYLSSGSCQPCMRVCSTCTTGTTCASPIGNLVMNGNVAECSSGKFFDNSTQTCKVCTYFDANCATCDYNPTPFDPANIAPVECIAPSTGYYLQNGSTLACGSYCDACVNSTYCTTPTPTFTVDPVSGVSYCDDTLSPPLYITNSPPYSCQICSTVIAGCLACQNNTATECTSCGNGYWSASYPVSTCTQCQSLCATCSDGSTCDTCINNLVHNNGTGACECIAPTFLHSVTQTCQSCPGLILHCSTCIYSSPNVVCTGCDDNFYVVAGACTQCADPLCKTCDGTGCLSCQNGYTPSGSTCICDPSDCGACQANTGDAACAACSSGNIAPCTDCIAGYYMNTGGTCTICPDRCNECSYNATSTQLECSTCNSAFIFDFTYDCVCDNSASLYLTLNASTCDTCSNIVPNCTACDDSSGSTVCTAAISGHFVDPATNTTVLPCNQTCTECVGAANNCTACLNTYEMVTPGNCECDNVNGDFYNPVSLGCSPCADLVANCASCAVNGGNASLTDCATCSAPYYVNSSSGQCVTCPSECSSCLNETYCSGCANNLVLSQLIALGVNGLCVCDNSSTTDIYYNTANNKCQACANILSSCQNCSALANGTILCLTCANGTYLQNDTCHICSSECQTCDSTGCITCPSGTTLSGNTCQCGTSCSQCSGASPNCLQCTMSGVSVASCSSCSPGYFVMGASCLACPVSCATCTASSSCGICQATYQLQFGRCVCDSSENLYQNNGQCSVCTDIVTSCAECSYDGISTTCLTCDTGYYVSSSTCLPCNASCGSCSSDPNNCTTCTSGYTLVNNTCSCDVACTTCAGYWPNCIECNYDIYNLFASCKTCEDTFYLNSSTGSCDNCPSDCHKCGSGGACTVCPTTYQLISDRCQCNTALNMYQNNNTMQCESCSSLQGNCSTCQYNASSTDNVACTGCITGFYLQNETCYESVCGDGTLNPLKECDDGNNQGGDGCNNCFIQLNYACSGQPSVCTVSVDYTISSRSVSVDPLECNKISFAFDIDPYYESYDDANFTAYLTGTNSSAIQRTGWRYRQGKGVIIYDYQIVRNLDKRPIAFYFSPSLLGVNQTKDIPLITVEQIIKSTNNIKPYRLSEDKCSKKAAVKTFTESMEYGSYGVMAASAVPCKVVGLEMFGVLQLAHLSVGSMDNVNPLLTPLMSMKGVHGYSAELDDTDDNPSSDTDGRLLSTTPDRVSSIGYSSNFLRNCNVMIWVTVGLMAIAFFFVAFSCLCKQCCPCMYAFSRRIMKQLLLTLILFNCFNFAYSAGIHFQYNSPQDNLHAWGTIAAVASLVLPLAMAIGLACTQQVGFGEFKEKMKMGAVQKAYFIVTILYRTGLGLYMSLQNASQLSTLIVLAISILFLLYNLVNLPFTKAYHNYRANICHLSQFVCLFIALYYRSMKSTTSSSEVADEEYPAYIFLASILLSFVVSFVVLIYEVVTFIIDCCTKKEEELPSEESKSHLQHQKDEKRFVTEDNLANEHHSHLSELHPSQIGNIDFDAYQ